jgi:dihydrofolate synthase / folylpolyglutamate synthase
VTPVAKKWKLKVEDAIAYLNSLGLHRINPGLERIAKLLEILGNPQDEIPSIIIAGTNGKGSVAAAVASVLGQCYKTGLYTSPHLIRISERIKINGEEISIHDLSRLVLEIKEASSHLSEGLTYFEVLTAAAFLYFARRKIDFSVLEVGMGGRWDATNVITPLVSVITNISKDHTEFLGETAEEIAFEKAGVIKHGVPLVTAAKQEALKVIETLSYKNFAPISVMEKDFKIEGENTEDFSFFGRAWNLKHLQFNLPGFYQIENASVAIAVLETISQFHGVNIGEENLRKGLSSVRWEGRMEILRKNPPLVLDGAHNPGAAQALRKSIQEMFPEKKFIFLIGMLRDKDHKTYLSEISQVAEGIIITDVPSERGIKSEKLAEIADKFLKDIEIIKDFKEAFCKVKALRTPVCVTGSLYLIGAIKSLSS